MYVAHFSDLHYSPTNLVEADRCFTFAVTDAIENFAKLAVISGDSTDHRLDAHSPALNALATQVHRLSRKMPVIMLQGTFSHEPPGTLDNFAFMSASEPILIADEVRQSAFLSGFMDGGEFVTSSGPVFSDEEITRLLPRKPLFVVTALPTISKGELAVQLGATNVATDLADVLCDYLRAAGRVNERFRAAGVPTIGISHGTVNGCQTEHGVTMAGFDHEFSTSALFDANCSAFLLGHIHKEQSWEYAGRMIGYPGSIGRFHYGENGQKGYLFWDVNAKGARRRVVATPARETLCIDFDGAPDMARLVEAAAQASDKFVRVRWQIDEEHLQSVDRDAVRRLFAGAADLKIEARILPVTRSRAQGISLETSLDGKLTRWAQVADVDPDPLMSRLDWLMAADAPEIAAEVLSHLQSEEGDVTVDADGPAAADADADGICSSIEPVADASPDVEVIATTAPDLATAERAGILEALFSGI